ncbi:hypothetical protein VPH35_137894 [Triticum aestivum]|uniref:Pentatricopeptide repeat-containing protein n=1 Tax=Aegilops tauschii TaxID=37682 RepID=N1QWY8_AEGTA
MYAKVGCMDAALHVFASSKERNSITWSAVITGYAQNGNAESAFRMFLQMLTEGFSPMMWEHRWKESTHMVDGEASRHNGEHEEALRLYARMDKEGITLTNLTTSIARRGYPSLVNFLMNCDLRHLPAHYHQYLQENEVKANTVGSYPMNNGGCTSRKAKGNFQRFKHDTLHATISYGLVIELLHMSSILVSKSSG